MVFFFVLESKINAFAEIFSQIPCIFDMQFLFTFCEFVYVHPRGASRDPLRVLLAKESNPSNVFDHLTQISSESQLTHGQNNSLLLQENFCLLQLYIFN